MARRKDSPGLGWALAVSLLLNHTLVVPGAFLLLTRQPPAPRSEGPVEIELVPDPQPAAIAPQAPEPHEPLASISPRPPQPPPEPTKPTKPPEPEKREPEKKTPQPPQPPKRMKMVELATPESKTPPKEARFLSDKDRQVERETRARDTNLVKDHPRPEPHSRPSASQEPTSGSKERRIAATRDQQAREQQQKLQQQREQQQRRRERAAARVSPLLAMRAPAEGRPELDERSSLAEESPDGTLPRARERQEGQSRAAPRSPQSPQSPRSPQSMAELELDYRSHDRIYGKEATRQREQARLSPSMSQGRHDKKWARIRAALENFIPEVQPGNQTALGTRADPFAVYIARMHRKIHDYWGFGFIVDLDAKPASNPMNNMSLWTMIEIVITPDGQVEKATIVRPSGILPFDVAALDTVFSANPYEPTPKVIRSADGRVYMHWRFHRDQRQCGTFGVDPFILTKPPRGPIDTDVSKLSTARQDYGAALAKNWEREGVRRRMARLGR